MPPHPTLLMHLQLRSIELVPLRGSIHVHVRCGAGKAGCGAACRERNPPEASRPLDAPALHRACPTSACTSLCSQAHAALLRCRPATLPPCRPMFVQEDGQHMGRQLLGAAVLGQLPPHRHVCHHHQRSLQHHRQLCLQAAHLGPRPPRAAQPPAQPRATALPPVSAGCLALCRSHRTQAWPASQCVGGAPLALHGCRRGCHYQQRLARRRWGLCKSGCFAVTVFGTSVHDCCHARRPPPPSPSPPPKPPPAPPVAGSFSLPINVPSVPFLSGQMSVSMSHQLSRASSWPPC